VTVDAPDGLRPEPARRPVRAAVVGCGVIGATWAARLALNGVPVAVADPASTTRDLLDRVLAAATAAWDDLGLPTDQRAPVAVVDSIEAAVDGAEMVQESVPEQPELKAGVLAAVDAATGPEVLIASSTSGLRPSDLQAGLRHPERLVVGHPFNPVYLLPLVEVVGGRATSEATVERAMACYRGLGMHPLRVRVEIDAFIADRLLEAVWREALWLVADGVATTAEIDDAITHGFGLRWGQMGLFETYRVAGGDGGFRHFIEQFGPALDWPWSRLTHTPEFTPGLVDRIVEQSDRQSGHHGPGELERIRDRNLAGFLRVLERQRWGAGTTLAAHRRALGGSTPDLQPDRP
jgi:carnitine 3-dehydrogenase